MPARKSDPREPDTTADKEAYGFHTIEETEPAEGPGSIEPTQVEPLSSVPNTTFASRKQASGKAVQSSENKAVRASDTK